MLTGEARHLQERGVANLSEEERRRLNRLLIDAAFPDYILPAPGKVLVRGVVRLPFGDAAAV